MQLRPKETIKNSFSRFNLMKGGKGQSSLEALSLIGILTFFLILTAGAVSNQLVKANQNNYISLLNEIADVIQTEATLAQNSENGYFHAFSLPQTVNGQLYGVSIMNSTDLSALGFQANATLLIVSSGRADVRTNITRNLPKGVLGNLFIGQVSVKKENGIVMLDAKLYPPQIESITPSSGTMYGFTPVVIIGRYFLGPLAVTFGGTEAPSVIVENQFKIEAITPAHVAGFVDVIVTNPDGQSATLSSGYNYISPPPTVESISPPSGYSSGGTSVTITGTNFFGIPTVSFGGTESDSVSFVDSTQLDVITPPGLAGTVDVVVTNPDSQSGTLNNGFTYIPPPRVDSISPVSGSTLGGSTVSVIGTDFFGTPSVTFDGTPVSVIGAGSERLDVTIPVHAAGPVDIVVTNPDGQSDSLVDGFTYIPPPTLASVNPPSGYTTGGTAVTVTGTDFFGTPTVTFGGAAATGVTLVDSARLDVITSPHAAGVVDVEVTNPDGQLAHRNSMYTYMLPPPTVSSSDPSGGSISGGTPVTISGSDFVSGATVAFGGVASPSVTFVSGSELNVLTPAHAAGVVDVEVTNPDRNSGTLSNWFTYNNLPPTLLETFRPRIGPFSGGTTVTISGTNFVATPTVTFGGVASPSVTFISSTRVQAITPLTAVGYVTITLTNPDAQSATTTSQFLQRVEPVPVGTAFVRSASFNGNLGGLAGADAKCQETADDGGFGGVWTAWLSTSTVNAKDRIPDTVYRRLDNAVVANSKADLTDGSIAAPISVADDGSNYIGGAGVWTGTTQSGLYDSSQNSCLDWTSPIFSNTGQLGNAAATNREWTTNFLANCNSNLRLYCFRTS